MSEELRARGYMDAKGRVHGDPVGPFEGFVLGATTLDQLRRCGLVPDRSYGGLRNKKPDGLVVDRRGDVPVVKLVVEYKDTGELTTETRVSDVLQKLADEYCSPLECALGGLSDSQRHSWILVDRNSWQMIRREDDYPLDSPLELGTDAGRSLLLRTLERLDTSLDRSKAALVPLEAVNPTRLAEQTWQDIWLACGREPDACLATFVELLIFKFLSDLNVLRHSANGVPVDFATVVAKPPETVLRYYYEHVRPTIKTIFPPGQDRTSVINGMVLDPRVLDQGRLFLQILLRFRDFGSLRRIDPEFKSRIFERFLKRDLSVKNWGQYFTPRNVIKAMVEMSGIERLPPSAVVADPACGVGGFILEPLMNKRPHDFRSADAPSLKYVGWDRDDKTVILAKANMLIHLSDLLERDPVGSLPFLAKVLNETFASTSSSGAGSLSNTPEAQFDLVMTNPPYVVRGTGKHRDLLRQNRTVAEYYAVQGTGIENLFLQMIIHGLKPGGRAVVILPDGLLLRHSEQALRAHLLRTCYLEAIVSLPQDTFFSTPKKTYVVTFRKKLNPADQQTDPVFAYLVTKVGETLDAKRFATNTNDLPKMASSFRLFQGNPPEFSSLDPRCKVFPIQRFTPEDHWLVNKWWSREEREALGDLDEERLTTPLGLATVLQDMSTVVTKQIEGLRDVEEPYPITQVVTVSLSDRGLFRMGIGKRVLRKDLFYATKGAVPLYSANVEPGNEHGWIAQSNLSDFARPSLLWSIDSDFNMSVRIPGEIFATTDHCGRLELLVDNLDPEYCKAAISYGFGRAFGFDRVTRPSLQRMKKVSFPVPVDCTGSFDLTAQRVLARQYTVVQDALAEVKAAFGHLADLKPRVDLPQSPAT